MAVPINSRLGRYEILSRIGAGGMGEVYRARDTKLGRDVAIKVLPEAFAQNGERMARFEREAKLLAVLNHPNVAAIYGVEDSASTDALVMELAEGPTLADRLAASGPIPVTEALPIARQIADALEYAHEHGVVHRDLKPANIKISRDDAVKILDFGLAKAIQGEADVTDAGNSPTVTEIGTKAGVLLGTAAYMSPEQARAKPVDRRADIWAFGCVLYEMLTGKRAYQADSVAETLAAILQNDPDWSRLPSATPVHVRVMLHRCLQKDPKQRLRDIGDARISLDEVLSGAAEATSGAAVKAPLWRRVLPWAATFVTGAGLLVGTVLLVPVIHRPHSATMQFRAVTNFSGVQAYPALSPDGRSVAFVSDRDGHYDIYIGLITGGNPVKLTEDPNLKTRPRWSPDGTEIAYARLNDSGVWDIWEVPALGGTPRRLILNAADPDWSRDGRSIAYRNSSTDAIWISDSLGQNGRELESTRHPNLGTLANSGPRFSPDGREIAFAKSSGGPQAELEIVNLDSGKVRELTNDDALMLSPAWSGDGRFIYFASSRSGTLNIWKIAQSGGEPEQITAGQGDDVQLDVSADGRRIVFSTFRSNINLAQLNLGAGGPQSTKLLTIDLARSQLGPAYSPDGKHLAYFSYLKAVEREGIWLANSDGSHPVPLVQDGRHNMFPRWTSDSAYLVYASLSLTASSEFRRLSISGGAPQTLLKGVADFLPDVGSEGQVLFKGSGGQVQLFVSQNIQTLTTLPPDERAFLFRWSPDAHSIAYMVSPTREDDLRAGLWVFDRNGPQRQIFRGWVTWYMWTPKNEIYLIEAKADMKGVLWKLDRSGHGLTRIPGSIPLPFDYWFNVPFTQFDISPDGRYMAYMIQEAPQANIGMLDIH
jgi:Tol biopolymer transport system component